MKKLANLIVKGRIVIVIAFAVLSILCGYLATKVKINYDLASYLPKDARSTVAIDKVRDEYTDNSPNLEVGIPCDTLTDALNYKKELQSLEHVHSVLWLDDQVDIGVPLALSNQKLVDGFYKEGMALFQVTVDTSEDVPELEFLTKLYDTIGDDAAVRGQLVEHAHMQSATTSEVTSIASSALPIAFVILLLSTTSWFEPVLFMVVIFSGVLLNMGTNLIFDDISFITQSIGAILQLAVSMDYGIFLLHRFSDYRAEGHDIKEAMKLAIEKSVAPVLASALTTIFGFLALVFMRFGIGFDLGLVLAKGVFFSLLSSFMLLPALTTLTYKLIDKTTHRSFMPSFKKPSRWIIKFCIPIMIAAAIVIAPAFLAQRSNRLLYGARTYPENSRQERDALLLEERFGNNVPMALLVPRGDWAREGRLVDELIDVPEIKSAIGYVTAVGRGIPNEILPERLMSPLLSEHYSRIILIADSPDEAPETFETAEKIRVIVDEAYPDGDTHLTGANMVLLDMRSTINKDILIVDGLAILAIALVILFTFRSLAIPMILVLTIELSIWINLAIPYLTGIPLNFIGFLVISTVQLGATVDYAILMTQHYLDHRLVLNRKDAAMRTIETVAGSIIPPALILASVCYVLYFSSSLAVVSEIGRVLGRGALTSLGMVLFLLPNFLRFFDPLIEKTTWKLKLLPDKHSYRRKPRGASGRRRQEYSPLKMDQQEDLS